MRKAAASLLVLSILVLCVAGPITALAKGGHGGGQSISSKHTGSGGSGAHRVKVRRKHRVVKRRVSRAAKHTRSLRPARLQKAVRGRDKEQRKEQRAKVQEDESATAPPKLRGRENAFARISAKLWRMPESALKGLLNALANIGKWIGLTPPEGPFLPPSSETTSTPEPTVTPSPGSTATP